MFLEGWITHRNVKRMEAELQQQMIDENKIRQGGLQNYLAYSVANTQASIDAILLSILQYPQIRDQFEPSEKNISRQTWFNASSLLLYNKWISFFQSTLDHQLGSTLLPSSSLIRNAQILPLKGDTVWARLQNSERFYVGILVPIENGSQTGLSSKRTRLYLLLDWKTLDPLIKNYKHANKNHDYHGIDSFFSLWGVTNIPAFIDSLFKELSVALEGIKELIGSELGQHTEEAIEQKLANHLQTNSHSNHLYFNDPIVEEKIEDNMKQSDQVVMTWALSALIDLFTGSTNPFQPLAPSGVIRSQDAIYHEGFLSSEVFSDQILFDDKNYFDHNTQSIDDGMIGQSIAIISPKGSSNLYLGNVLRLTAGTKESFLTLGMDGNSLLRDLSQLMHQEVILVSDNRIISAYSENGTKDQNASSRNYPIASMMEQTQGIVSLDGNSYYYMHLKPFSHIDLNFFLLNPTAKAFALLNDIDASIKGIIHNLSLYMQIVSLLSLCIAIVVLHKFSSNITRPITTLAEAAKKVGQGELDNITLPVIRPTQRDEIYTLCTSFGGMVQGLKEKEQVKGVLNKVVSPDIAREILQSPLHLGGEEKEITILFADIRHFTSMTEHMAAQDVITLLNECMSKISAVIDDYHGVIDKYVGDAAMALFGIPKFSEHCTLDAVLAAIEIMKRLNAWNADRKRQGLKEVTMGIGIHTGKAILGNMGSENRLNYTAIGAGVNLASRVCSIAGEMQILISESVYNDPRVAAAVTCEKLDDRMIKGFEKPIPLFAVKEKNHV